MRYALLSLIVASHAAAQCSWLPGYTYTSSPLNGNIPALTTWDPPGPAPEVLVVSSSFPVPGGTPVKLGFFDGTNWTTPPAGPRINPAAFAVYQGKLIVGGFAGTVTGPTIASWDGQQWQTLGGGLDGAVRTLLVHDGDLFAGGEFFTADGITVNKIARWDGEQWHDVGGGVTGADFPMVMALASSKGALIAAGFFQFAGQTPVLNIAAWDGESWSTLGEGRPGGAVFGVSVYKGKVVAGGVSPLAQWDGVSWTPLGTGLNQSARTMAHFKGDLIVGGFFQIAGGQTVNHVARWDGSQWFPLSTGVVGTAFGTANVTALTTFEGRLCVGGFFDTAGGQSSVNLARWGCAACYANCDGSTGSPVLTANDFQCFLNKYASGDPSANCDGSTGTPILTANDFQCFLNAFAQGCP